MAGIIKMFPANFDRSPAGALASTSIERVTSTSEIKLGIDHAGRLIDITSGTFTQTFYPAAALKNGWFVYIRNSGTGVITLDPNASETIDGSTTLTLNSGESALVQCDGSNFYTATRKTQSGLVLLGSITPTVAASISAPNIFSSAYDNYLILGTNITASATDSLKMRLAVGGVVNSSNVYYSGGGFSNNSWSTLSTGPYIGPYFTLGRAGSNFSLTLEGMNSSTSNKSAFCHSVQETGAGAYASSGVFVACNLTSVISGIAFHWHGASNFGATGIIEIYGYNKKVGAI